MTKLRWSTSFSSTRKWSELTKAISQDKSDKKEEAPSSNFHQELESTIKQLTQMRDALYHATKLTQAKTQPPVSDQTECVETVETLTL